MHANGAFVLGFRFLTVPKDAWAFLRWAMSFANVYIWSTAMLKTVEQRLLRGFPEIMNYFGGWAGQELCDAGKYVFPGFKPVFFKTLQNFLSLVDCPNDGRILIIDDSGYKVSGNPNGSYIIVPSIAKRQTDYLTTVLKKWLFGWFTASDCREVAEDFERPPRTEDDRYVARAIAAGKPKISYA